MSIEKVRNYLKKYSLDSRILEFDASSATVDLAAVALHTDAARIAKSISLSDGNGGCILIVTAGDMKIDNSKYKKFFSLKAKMLSPDEALDLTGHAVGGVCPFALPESVKLYLDLSLKRFKTVFPACGSSHSAIELTPDELAECTPYIEWIDVCKPKEEINV